MAGDGENGVDHVEGNEEVLVQIPNAIVHLIDEEESPHLGSGDFSVVKITQQGTALVVLVRVGDNLQWPLTEDVPTVKLDPTHYFFTLRVPAEVERQVEEEVHLPADFSSFYFMFSCVSYRHLRTSFEWQHLRLSLDVLLHDGILEGR